MVQHTLKTSVPFKGVGLHSGQPIRMVLHPASAEYGIWFRRTDLRDVDNLIPARWDSVEPSRLCTKVVNNAGASVSTIEHLMAALAGLGVHNVLVEIDGPEVPILDGSSAPFVRAILARGLRRLNAPVRVVHVLEPVEVRDGDAVARLDPSDRFEMAFSIDFVDRAIGHQARQIDLCNGAFVRELCDSRTFCRRSDVDMMRENGLALGGTFDNAVVVDGDRVLSPGGLRHRDEPVRHKMLDALGDLYLAGGPILGRFTGVRSGHALTAQLLRALFARPGAARMVLADRETSLALPGVGVDVADLALCA